mmetsp:Transcript_15504/g.27517  ORF Transcript_15504/g.27517 Transcript_15504/m.27517 type:complete len:336 (-) Transcript_15504:392-1399(-)
MLLVEILEDIFVLQEAENCDDLLETGIDFNVAGHALETLAEHVVHEQRKVLCCPCVLVQEGLKSLLQGQLEVFALLEGILHKLVILVFQTQNRRDEGHGILDFLGIVEDVPACLADAVHHDLLNLLQSLWYSAEEQIHPLKVTHLVVVKHPRTPRVFHVDKRLVVAVDPLLVAQLLNFLHGRLMEIIFNPRLFLADALLRLFEIVRAGVLRNVLHRLILVELPSVVQELILKALPVNILALHTKLYKHVYRVLQQNSIHLLAASLSGNVFKHQRQEMRLHPAVSGDVLPENDQTHLVDRHLLVLSHKVPVHIHQDVTDHDHCGFVVIPLFFQLVQ